MIRDCDIEVHRFLDHYCLIELKTDINNWHMEESFKQTKRLKGCLEYWIWCLLILKTFDVAYIMTVWKKTNSVGVTMLMIPIQIAIWDKILIIISVYNSLRLSDHKQRFLNMITSLYANKGKVWGREGGARVSSISCVNHPVINPLTLNLFKLCCMGVTKAYT